MNKKQQNEKLASFIQIPMFQNPAGYLVHNRYSQISELGKWGLNT